MAKTNKTPNAKPATTNAPAPALDWNKETATLIAAGKEKGGSRGDQLGRVAKFLAGEGPAVDFLRQAAGERGAQAFIQQPRNVLAKLERLAKCVVSGQAWCSLAGMSEDGKRKEDASVVIALGSLGAGDERQKAIVAAASKRYPGGANAQMPAALDACAFVGIVARKDTATARNAEYTIVDKAKADALIPKN